MTAPDVRWLSFHVFLRCSLWSRDCDEVMIHLLNPLTRMLHREFDVGRWFIIRYGERGPHLRLRLLTPVSVSATAVQAALCAFLDREGQAEYALAAPRADDAISYRTESPYVLAIPYEPEIDRYGGPAAIPHTEGMFHLWTDVVIELLAAHQPNTLSDRVALSAIACAALLRTVHADGQWAARVALQYRDTFIDRAGDDMPGEGRVAELRRAAHSNANLTSVVQSVYWDMSAVDIPSVSAIESTIAQRFQEIAALLPARSEVPVVHGRPVSLETIVVSHLHMNSNRLGVPPRCEPLVAEIVATAIAEGSRVEALDA